MLPFGSMRVTAISDLHGAVEHLDAVARDCDALLVLGDLINVLDYRTMDGILVEVFGREPVAEAARLPTQGRFDEARAAIRRQVGEEHEVRARFVDLARQEYERVMAALPDQSYVTFGNVDIPEMLQGMARNGIRFVDGDVVRLGSLTFGFVGGGIQTPLGVPGEVPEEQFDAKLERIGSDPSMWCARTCRRGFRGTSTTWWRSGSNRDRWGCSATSSDTIRGIRCSATSTSPSSIEERSVRRRW